MSKLLALISLCVMLVAVHSQYAEESRDEDGEDEGTWIKMERCDDNMCGTVEQCHDCCHHNFHLDYAAANGKIQEEHAAIDNMCSCFHKVNGHQHNSGEEQH